MTANEQEQTRRIELRDSLNRISEELDQIDDSISQYFPSYVPISTQKENVIFDHYKSLSEEAVVLEYFMSNDVIYLFELTPDSVQFHRIGKASLLADVGTFNSGISE